jgi:hypothetical protein
MGALGVGVPEAAVGVEPGVELGERLGAEAVPAALGVAADLDEAGVAEGAKVLGDGGLGEGKAVDEVADGSLAGAEEVEDAPAGGVGEGVEGGGGLAHMRGGEWRAQRAAGAGRGGRGRAIEVDGEAEAALAEGLDADGRDGGELLAEAVDVGVDGATAG